MKRNIIYPLFAAVCLALLVMTSISVMVLSKELRVARSNSERNDTEYVYIYLDTETDGTTETEIRSWTVKAHGEKIGVFDNNGTLLRIIETYTKTLPKAERDLLREGIEVSSKTELYSIIEAYTD